MAVKARRPSNQNRLTHPPICVPRQGSHYGHVPLARDVMLFCTAGDPPPFARPTHDRSSTSSRLATRGYGSKAVGPARRGRFGQQSGQTGCSQMSTMWRVSKCIARPPCPIILQINSKDIRSCQPENVGRSVGVSWSTPSGGSSRCANVKASGHCGEVLQQHTGTPPGSALEDQPLPHRNVGGTAFRRYRIADITAR